MAGPELYRGLAREHARLILELPYANDNRWWIKDVCGSYTRPEFNRKDKVWEVARSHYWTLIEACVERYGIVTVVEDYALQEKCTRSCTNARPESVNECTCVCGGDHHGMDRGGSLRDGWIEVGDELLIGTDYRRRTFEVTADSLR
jgi:hypothetical protein